MFLFLLVLCDVPIISLLFQSFCPTVTYTFYSLTFLQICFLFILSPTGFESACQFFLQSPCWLLCLTFLSSWFWFLLGFLVFFFFFFPLVCFFCLAFVSSAFEVENFLSTLPDGPSEHKVESWTAISESIFGKAHRSLEVQLQGKPLSAISDVPYMDRSFKFSAMSL